MTSEEFKTLEHLLFKWAWECADPNNTDQNVVDLIRILKRSLADHKDNVDKIELSTFGLIKDFLTIKDAYEQVGLINAIKEHREQARSLEGVKIDLKKSKAIVEAMATHYGWKLKESITPTPVPGSGRPRW